MKPKRMKIPDYQERLKTVCPSLAFTVRRYRDETFVWDGDGPDPVKKGYYPHDVEVAAKAIVNGEIVEGNSWLGGSCFETGEPNGDVHGYLPQMLNDAAAALVTVLREHKAKRTLILEAVAAVGFTKGVMRKKWRDQQLGGKRQ